ncbi:DNA-processing protein DprA [Streptosporangium sp. NPDC006007]|uniref:DNA-processing protein DprA n=1 Tax=Streptosporangium sp. NPDC006007 TaxID=3154575 RepID=UPI0033A486FE
MGRTGDLATGMADEERIVVSGGAYGIEGAAHRAVLAAGGQTIAVLPSGLDRPYPAAHSDLLRQAGDAGLSVTELPPGAAPTEHRFTARNRLMAALSGATVISGAGVRSGPITTVLVARDLGRDVGAVPGPVTSAASSGPNELIRQGFAVLITQPSDVTALLDADVVPGKAVVRPVIGWELTNRGPSRGTPGPTL